MDSADVKAFFERVSTQWDEMRSSFYNAGVIDALAEQGRVTSTSRVVDVGTGTGFVAAGLAGRAATVIGVDNSPAMLAVAADNLTAIGADNVMLAEGDVHDLRAAGRQRRRRGGEHAATARTGAGRETGRDGVRCAPSCR